MNQMLADSLGGSPPFLFPQGRVKANERAGARESAPERARVRDEMSRFARQRADVQSGCYAEHKARRMRFKLSGVRIGAGAPERA